jgi:hypothetical protein
VSRQFSLPHGKTREKIKFGPETARQISRETILTQWVSMPRKVEPAAPGKENVFPANPLAGKRQGKTTRM